MKRSSLPLPERIGLGVFVVLQILVVMMLRVQAAPVTAHDVLQMEVCALIVTMPLWLIARAIAFIVRG